MKQSPLHLQIPEPCHENWANMKPVEQGRFCLSCQKTVVDFRAMTDRQVLEYFSNYTGSTCGRFYPDQLNRNIVVGAQKPRQWYKYMLSLFMPALLLANKASAQGRVKPDVPKTVQPAKVNQPVRCETKEWMMGDVAKIPLDTAKPILVKRIEYEFHGIAGGLVSVPRQPKQTIFHKFTRFLADSVSKSLVLYPNAAKPGSVVNISYKIDKGRYFIHLVSLAGQALQEEAINIGAKTNTLSFRLQNNISAGQYSVVIINSRGKRISTGKLIVQ